MLCCLSSVGYQSDVHIERQEPLVCQSAEVGQVHFQAPACLPAKAGAEMRAQMWDCRCLHGSFCYGCFHSQAAFDILLSQVGVTQWEHHRSEA